MIWYDVSNKENGVTGVEEYYQRHSEQNNHPLVRNMIIDIHYFIKLSLIGKPIDLLFKQNRALIHFWFLIDYETFYKRFISFDVCIVSPLEKYCKVVSMKWAPREGVCPFWMWGDACLDAIIIANNGNYWLIFNNQKNIIYR